MRTFFKTALLSFFVLTFGSKMFAQTESPSLRDIEREMRELQQQLMDQFQNNPFNDPNFAMPQWDTTFFFHFDTTFEGGNMSHFFRFSPFGSDSTTMDGFYGFGRMFDQFFNPDGEFAPRH